MTRIRRASAGRAAGPKPRCKDCFFEQNMLCALSVKEPCPTFRPAHPEGLRPPEQLAFPFRHAPRTASFSSRSTENEPGLAPAGGAVPFRQPA